jgi:hypothetical protein
MGTLGLAGLEAFEDAGLLEMAAQLLVEAAARLGLLADDGVLDGLVVEAVGFLLLLGEDGARTVLDLLRDLVVVPCALGDAGDLGLDGVVERAEIFPNFF